MSQTDSDIDDIPIDDSVNNDAEGDSGEEVIEEDSDYYDPEHYLSGYRISKQGTLPENVLEFHFSYGYNCRKHFNLVILDSNTVVFASGNLLNFFELESKKIWFRRSALGGGIAHIRKNPNADYPHFAVAESGHRPIIIMYQWPAMSIICILKGGAKCLYSNMDYSPDGELLVSQSGEPDYLITLWNWREKKILLRNKSYVNDVYRVKFSPYIPGQLTTCGVSHIKFWKMAATFTGLKLKGEVGRFGKTEYSDILGVLPMPDSKVVSGCEWGNMLIWDAGLITLEIFRSSRRKCHDAPIVQIQYNEGELWTVSLDGHVRIWWYEKIDHADPPDDDRVLLLDPSYDFYTPGLMLYCIEKRHDDPYDSWYVGQDGNGGIWLIDMNTEVEPRPSKQLYKCHAGEVVDIAAYPSGPYLASLGRDGRLYLYDYLHKSLVFDHEFPAEGSCLIWLGSDIVKTSDVILAGFDDGQIRVCCLRHLDDDKKISLIITQIIKPHNKPITGISINTSAEVLVSGSEDKTIFVFALKIENGTNDLLVPIGFIPTPDVMTCIAWHPQNNLTAIIGCMHGQMMQVDVPSEPQWYTTISYLLQVKCRYLNFKTHKSQIRRNIQIKKTQDRKIEKIERKRKEMEQIKKDNPGLEIDEETFLADSESEEKLEPLFIPEVPNKILWLRYTEDNTIWLSMGGYDAGYIYEYKIDQKEQEPYRFKMVDDADNIEISSYVYDYRKDYLIFAMQDGSIRVNKVNKNDFRDVSDYWLISMHDNQNGFVPKMCFSHDGKFFFSCGFDGNVFSYKFQPKMYIYPRTSRADRREYVPDRVRDVDNSYVKLSLEETKLKSDEDRIQKAANDHKTRVRNIMKSLKERYSRVLVENASLLPSQTIGRERLELDPRITEHIDDEFDEKLELVKRKLAHDLERSKVQMTKLKKYVTDPLDKHPILVQAINNPKIDLMTVRQRVMSPMFNVMLKLVEEKLIEEREKSRPPERVQVVQKQTVQKQKKPSALEYFLLSLSPSVIEHKLGPKLNRMLNKYRERREKWDKRLEEWDRFMMRKPVPGRNHPDDEKLLMEARESIGDYKLKESDDYKPPPHLRETTVKKYKQVLDARLKQNNLRHRFIQKVWDIRDMKYVIRDQLIEQRQKCISLNEELPQSVHKLGPDIPPVIAAEFPEKKLEPVVIFDDEEFEAMGTDDGQKTIISMDHDLEEREILPERTSFPPVANGIFKYPYSVEAIATIMESDIESLVDIPEENDSSFEVDLRTRRLTRKLFEQEQTILKMTEDADNFNEMMVEARKERLPIHVGGNFIDIYIVTLNQELNVLKKFDDGEELLFRKVNDNLKLVHQLQDEIDILKMSEEEYDILIENMLIEENKIQEKFRHATENNKFYDFLKKVFRKKYKPPKQTDADESSSESSSSSSEESDIDESGSIDSRDFGIIKQDLNTCPKGCELAIYDLAVDLRSKRHEVEQAVKEKTRALEMLKKNIELGKRKMTVLQTQLKASQTELEDYQREKQRRLNQVRCTVVLRLDQIHDYNPESDEITDYLVFRKATVADLYKRVGTLQHENYEQKSKYNLYQKHLTRMKKDLGYMQNKVKYLKQYMSQLMLDKFGKVVDINEIELAILKKTFQKSHVNELEEVVLKKLVYDLRMKNTDIKKLFITELNIWQEKISNAQAELTKNIKENTKRLELLQVMSKEKEELLRIIQLQPKKKEQIEQILKIHTEYAKEIKKLESIHQDQCNQIQKMKVEMKMLRTKGHLPSKQQIEEAPSVGRRDAGGKKWIDYDKYIKLEEPVTKEVIQDVALPEFHATEVEDLVQELLRDILSNVSSKDSFDMNDMMENILSHILRCSSVQDIVVGIIENLPFEPSPEQRSSIGSTAVKIYEIQEPDMSDESFGRSVREILEDTIDEVLLSKGEAHEVILRLVEKLVESVPNDYLLKKESVDSIVAKISDTLSSLELDRENLSKSVESFSSVYKAEMLSLLNLVLERVYGAGIDYLYVLKY